MARRTRQTIIQRIALDGGKEIEAEFKALGDAGEKAFADLRRAADKLNNISPLAQRVTQLRSAFTSLAPAARTAQASFTALNIGLATTIKSYIALTAASAAANLSIVGIVKSAANSADELKKAAQGANLNIDTYQALNFAAAQSGLSSEDLNKVLSSLNEVIAETGKTTKDAFGQGLFPPIETREIDGATIRVLRFGSSMDEAKKKAIQSGTSLQTAFGTADITVRSLGDKLKEIPAQLSPMQAALEKLKIRGKLTGNLDKDLETISEAFKAFPEGPERASLAVDLFTKKFGRRLFPLLVQGREGLRQLKAEFTGKGIGFTKEQADLAEELNDKFSSIGVTVEGIKNQFGALFFELGLGFGNALEGNIEGLRGTILSFGQDILTKVTPYVKAFIDVLNGTGDTEEAARPGSAFTRINAIKDGLIAFGNAAVFIKDVVVSAFGLIKSAADKVATTINGLFGTKLTGGELIAGAVILKLIGGFKALGFAADAAWFILKKFDKFIGAPLANAIIGGAANVVRGTLVVGTLIGESILKGMRVVLSSQAIAALFTPIAAAARTAFSAGMLLATGAAGGPIGLIILGGIALATAVFIFWDDLIPPMVAGFNKLREEFKNKSLFDVLKEGVANAPAFAAPADPNDQNPLNALPDINTVEGSKTALDNLYDTVVKFFTLSTEGLPEELINLPDISIIDGISDAFTALGSKIADAFTALPGLVESAFSSMYSAVAGVIGNIGALIDGLVSKAIAAAQAIAAAAASIFSGGGGDTGSSDALGNAQPFATGGYVRGPGSGTSDSILARLSNGEFVQTARAVRYWGADFMHAINNLRNPFKGFARGGMVQQFKDGLPSFSMGGLVSDMNRSMQGMLQGPQLVPVASGVGRSTSSGFTLVLDGQSFAVAGSDDVVSQLSRAVTQRNARSMGNKPGWFR